MRSRTSPPRARAASTPARSSSSGTGANSTAVTRRTSPSRRCSRPPTRTRRPDGHHRLDHHRQDDRRRALRMSMPFYVAPEQWMKDKADFARKGIARGRALSALLYDDGILICAENSSTTLRKISEIYDRLFHILYDGTVVDETGFTVLGGEADAISDRLKATYQAGLGLAEALRAAVAALAGDRTLAADELEVA